MNSTARNFAPSLLRTAAVLLSIAAAPSLLAAGSKNPVGKLYVAILGGAAECIDKIKYFLSKGLDTLIIGVADPDPRQLDLFGEKVLPKIK